jgi:dCMP deaminase
MNNLDELSSSLEQELRRVDLKDDVYLGVAKNIARLSKDVNTQVGAIIVSNDGSPVSWGYNGTIPGFNDNEIPHSREYTELSYIENGEEVYFSENKYPFMEHAEANAIDFGDKDKMVDATIYVTAMPCKDCARKIVKRKISRVVVAPLLNNHDKNSSVGNDDNITKYLFSKGNVDLYIGDDEVSLKHPNKRD